MVVTTDWLIDKSALMRVQLVSEADLWLNRLERGLVRISTPTLLEVGHSAISGVNWYNTVLGPPPSLCPLEPVTPQAERRALEVQGMLARRGLHRAPSVADLLIAAIAEVGQLTVLHVDKDFDLIAEITGQPVERLQLLPKKKKQSLKLC